MNLKGKNILITGASFIGIHLIKQLFKLNVGSIRVVNKTSKHKKNLNNYLKEIEFIKRDLRDLSSAKESVKKIDIVFHLAADHGGRGYVDLFQGNTATNFLLDGSVFQACLQGNVQHIFYASSGCVYPNYLQQNISQNLYLNEKEVRSPYDADNMYGWAKLMGELTLKAYYKDFGMKSSIGRLFTVYGPYASESHAVMGTIAKAFIEQNPFEVWGNGSQIRNWTYVEDIVNGIIASVKNIDNAMPVNIGTQEKITVNEMAKLVLKKMEFKPESIKYINMPSGPLNRVANNSLAKKILNWQPQYTFEDGLNETIEWYRKSKNKVFIKKNLKDLLLKGY